MVCCQAVGACRVRSSLASSVGGVPADQIPDGVLPATAMLLAAKDAAPRRRTPLQEALDNDGSLTYHSHPR